MTDATKETLEHRTKLVAPMVDTMTATTDLLFNPGTPGLRSMVLHRIALDLLNAWCHVAREKLGCLDDASATVEALRFRLIKAGIAPDAKPDFLFCAATAERAAKQDTAGGYDRDGDARAAFAAVVAMYASAMVWLAVEFDAPRLKRNAELTHNCACDELSKMEIANENTAVPQCPA